jgi:hypothetical protein
LGLFCVCRQSSREKKVGRSEEALKVSFCFTNNSDHVF